jgi:hypothetical protein
MSAGAPYHGLVFGYARAVHRFLLVTLLLGCAKREDASWTKLPDVRVAGDSTVSGDPAKVSRFATPPVIDGKLDDAVWASAVTLGPFVDAGEGGDDLSALGGSFARAGWDDHALYLGFIVKDASPVAPFERSETDPHLWEKSSAVEVMLQPGDPGDNKDYYEMQYDTKGAAFDTHWDDYNVPIKDNAGTKLFGHQEWSSNAERAAYVSTDRYYSLEIAIPWSAFVAGRTASPPKSGDVWRMNLYAFRDGQAVSNAWSPIKRQGNFHKSSRFGRIKFL